MHYHECNVAIFLFYANRISVFCFIPAGILNMECLGHILWQWRGRFYLSNPSTEGKESGTSTKTFLNIFYHFHPRLRNAHNHVGIFAQIIRRSSKSTIESGVRTLNWLVKMIGQHRNSTLPKHEYTSFRWICSSYYTRQNVMKTDSAGYSNKNRYRSIQKIRYMSSCRLKFLCYRYLIQLICYQSNSSG